MKMGEKSVKSKIIKKVKGLLAIAKDEANDEECQSAFLLAQKLMIQYHIDQSEVADEMSDSISHRAVTVYKKLFWWEKELAGVISRNFCVKHFYSSKYVNKEDGQRKSCIKFYGLESDMELAKEMFILADDVMMFFYKDFIELYKKEYGTYEIADVKNSYLQGFIFGLNQAFEKQKAQFKQMSNELMILTEIPQMVVEAWEEYSQEMGEVSTDLPPIEVVVAFEEGRNQASKTDFTLHRIA